MVLVVNLRIRRIEMIASYGETLAVRELRPMNTLQIVKPRNIPYSWAEDIGGGSLSSSCGVHTKR